MLVEHAVNPAAHVSAQIPPPLQIMPDVHALPQVPQLRSSRLIFAQKGTPLESLQETNPREQLRAHCPMPLQV